MSTSSRGRVDGTPRWAVAAAWVALLSVLPSGLWRCLVGVGVPLGWSQAHLDLERIPGWGTLYVVSLTVLSVGAAALTLGLVQPWGDRFPAWFVAPTAALGGAAVAWIVVQSLRHWSSVSGFADRPGSPWALLMAACYAPAVLWAPAVWVALAGFLVRRRR